MLIRRIRIAAALTMLAIATPLFAADPLLPPEAAQGKKGEGVPNFSVRTGYKVTLAAGEVQNARFMQFDSNGILYLSQSDAGRITSFKYADGKLTKVADVATNQRAVHGLDFRDGWLWFTTAGAIHKGKVRPDGTGLDEMTDVIKDDGTLTPGGGHWWRPVLVGEKYFYTEIGDPGNATDVDASNAPLTKDREKIWRFNLDGTGKTLFASGLRNTEKLRFRPGTTEIWGCDHGSDDFGGSFAARGGRGGGGGGGGGAGRGGNPITDRVPGEELNYYEEGKFYGHPFIVGNMIPRIEFQNRPDILDIASRTTPPAMLFGAHWANNGFSFLSHDGLGMKGDILIAFHGSWNSTVLAGYRIQRVMFDQLSGKPIGSLPIVITLTPDGSQNLASPCDVAEAPDGSILFSSDVGPNRRGAGAIYRLSLDK